MTFAAVASYHLARVTDFRTQKRVCASAALFNVLLALSLHSVGSYRTHLYAPPVVAMLTLCLTFMSGLAWLAYRHVLRVHPHKVQIYLASPAA